VKAKAVLKAAARAAVAYALSKDARKIERALLAGVGVAVFTAIKAAIGS
jgi:hypothetical protein